jgi:hypothetical protein
MRLPDAARADLLELVGATPLAEGHLSEMIDSLAESLSNDRRKARAEPN